MEDTAKYLIHADVTADGVVERSDVVGAVFGQTEGLLGTEMDLRKLQEASKVGRIDVDVESERGSSFGTITIASSLDRVETAVLAASLETISRVGPCRSRVEVAGIEDVRAAKRRDVVDRAKELMAESFDGSMLTTQEILEEVRRSIRVEDITQWKGLPAGPHVGDSDAIIVVEGRADVLQLLQYGIKNAVAVEGTDVPEAVGELTLDRTVTAFFDGDRGGDLILKELAQVGDVDYVALAPPGRSVEELTRREVTESLREKMPYEVIAEGKGGVAATDGSVEPPPGGPPTPGVRTEAADQSVERGGVEDGDSPTDEPQSGDRAESSVESPGEDSSEGADGESPAADAERSSTASDASADASTTSDGSTASATSDDSTVSASDGSTASTSDDAGGSDGTLESANVTAGATESAVAGGAGGSEQAVAGQAGTEAVVSVEEPVPSTLVDHVRDVIEADTGSVRLLDESHGVLTEAPAAEAFETIESADDSPWAVILDDELTQRVLDVAAQRGVAHVVARETDDFVKRPTSVRIRTVGELLETHGE